MPTMSPIPGVHRCLRFLGLQQIPDPSDEATHADEVTHADETANEPLPGPELTPEPEPVAAGRPGDPSQVGLEEVAQRVVGGIALTTQAKELLG